MPELAEVEFFRRQWDPGLGQKIVAVQLHAHKRIFRGSNPRALKRELTGSRFLRSFAWGKQMLFEFSGGNWIGLHLGMTGKLRIEPPGFRPENDIASKTFDRAFFDAFLQRHARAPVKAVLLLQSGFAGIGNWMADEILWRAKISPLSAARRARLYRETRFVAVESLRIIGPDFSDPPRDWLIHQKWKRNGICPRHRTALQKAMVGARTTAWCARCQR
jgi:formamidopyrimidine-DNA glycosylase